MDNITIIAIILAVLTVQWPLAMAAAARLFTDGSGDKYSKAFIVLFNTAIIILPLIGPLSYFAFREVKKRKDIGKEGEKNEDDSKKSGS